MLIVIMIILIAVPIYTYCLTSRILRPIPKASRSLTTDAYFDNSQYPDGSLDTDGAAREAELTRRLIRHDIDGDVYRMAMSDLAHRHDVSSEQRDMKRLPGFDG